MSLEVTI